MRIVRTAWQLFLLLVLVLVLGPVLLVTGGCAAAQPCEVFAEQVTLVGETEDGEPVQIRAYLEVCMKEAI